MTSYNDHKCLTYEQISETIYASKINYLKLKIKRNLSKQSNVYNTWADTYNIIRIIKNTDDQYMVYVLWTN